MPESFGDYMMGAFTQGVEELRAANSGQLAMDAAPIEAPQAEAPQQDNSYSQMLAEAAQRPDPVSMEQSIDR